MSEEVEENKGSVDVQPKKSVAKKAPKEPAKPTTALWVATKFSDHAVVVNTGNKNRRMDTIRFSGHKLELDLTNPNDAEVHESLKDVIRRKHLSDIVLVRDVETPNTSAQKAEMSAYLQSLRVYALRAFLSNKERADAGIVMRSVADEDGIRMETAQLITVICDTKTFTME